MLPITILLFLFHFANTIQIEGLLNNTWDHVVNQLVNGSLSEGHLSVQDVHDIMSSLDQNLVAQSIIGHSYRNESIIAYYISNNLQTKKPSMLITSLHHAREVASLQMNIYLFLKVLWEIQNGNVFYQYYIRTASIYIVPFVNIDGYQLIAKKMSEQGVKYPQIRKNLNYTIPCDRNIEAGGIDLNRNYGLNFGQDNQGSSSEPCDEIYRGDSAFSEKETQAIKNIIESEKIHMAMNLHCYGDLWILPHDYELKNNSLANMIYKDFKKNGNFSQNSRIGNAEQMVGYPVNGEAADWMLSQNVISISPELGQDIQSYGDNHKFYPNSSQTIELFEQESVPLLHYINYLPFNPKIIYIREIINKFNEDKSDGDAYLAYLEIKIFNMGISKGDVKTELHISNQNISMRNGFIYVFDEINDNQSFEINNSVFNSKFNKIEINNNKVSLDQINGRQFAIFLIQFDLQHIFEQEQEQEQEQENSSNIEITIMYEELILQKNSLQFKLLEEQKSFSEDLIFYIIIVVSLVCVALILLFCWRRKQLSNFERNKNILFKQHLNNIFKVDGEF